MLIEKIGRVWNALAPKVVAFLASGLTSSGLIFVAQAFGWHVAPELAVMIVGAISGMFGYIQRDNLLVLAPGQFSLKLLAYIGTTITATMVLAFATQLGYDLSAYAGLIAALVTLVGALAGYWKRDTQVLETTGPTDSAVKITTVETIAAKR